MNENVGFQVVEEKEQYANVKNNIQNRNPSSTILATK